MAAATLKAENTRKGGNQDAPINVQRKRMHGIIEVEPGLSTHDESVGFLLGHEDRVERYERAP